MKSRSHAKFGTENICSALVYHSVNTAARNGETNTDHYKQDLHFSCQYHTHKN